MRTDSAGRASSLAGAAIAVLGLIVALLGTFTDLGWGLVSLLGLLLPPIGLAVGALGRRAAGDRVGGDAFAVFGGMGCHLFALGVGVVLAVLWLLGGGRHGLIAVLAWGVAALGYAGFAYAWDRATPTDVDVARGSS